MMKRTPGNIVIIGASSGLGLECAGIFGRLGWNVGIMSRRLSSLEQIKREMSAYSEGKILAGEIDVTDSESGDRLINMAENLGGADIILLTAGIGWANINLDLQKDIDTVRTDVEGFVRIVNTAFHYFEKRPSGGQIAAISSVAGTRGLGVSASYSASKSFDSTYLEALSQLAAIKKLPVKITDIRPGFVRTDLLDPGRNYPLLMSPEKAARQIVSAILTRRSVATVDFRWRALTFLWKLIPHSLWRKLKVKL